SFTLAATFLTASPSRFSSTSTRATSRSPAAMPGLPPPCPPQPMTAMPSLSSRAAADRTAGAPKTCAPAAAPASAADCFRKRRRLMFPVLIVFLSGESRRIISHISLVSSVHRLETSAALAAEAELVAIAHRHAVAEDDLDHLLAVSLAALLVTQRNDDLL